MLDQKGSILPFPTFRKPTVQVTLWDEPRRPDEGALRARLTQAGYLVVRWQNGPAEGYRAHAHIYPELLWIVSGSITVILPADKRLLELGPGDRMEVPAGVLHGILAGPDGAAYLLATR